MPEYQQSAVVPYVTNGDVVEIVLITSINTGQWSIPKGNIEPHLSAQDSALMEAHEEAGLSGQVIGEQFCDFRYQKWGGVCHVLVYMMQVDRIAEHWDESEYRQRCVVSIEKAIELIRPEQRVALEAFKRHINKM